MLTTMPLRANVLLLFFFWTTYFVCVESVLSCDRSLLVQKVNELFPRDGDVGLCDDRCSWECSEQLNSLIHLSSTCELLKEPLEYIQATFPYCYERVGWDGISVRPLPPFYYEVLENSTKTRQLCKDSILDGETLTEFAARHSLTWQEVMRLNPSLNIPLPSGDGHIFWASHSVELPTLDGEPLNSGTLLRIGVVYKIRQGDTLFTVANRFGVSVNKIVNQNSHLFDFRDFFGLLIFEDVELCITPQLASMFCPRESV